ncbi:lycopene cyclase family protein [Maribacter sp. CXY002]|uniref:lycopene cyclase family protein n=1 Tax=Maribacter luteocoastalis TaxID=3407671 RepID=UPI003B6827D2
MAKLHFDYIIIGAGAAGLMLADAMGKDSFFKDKSILLLDKDAKNINDRTWCFWEKGAGEFESLIHKKWNHILFRSSEFFKRFTIAPYTYKMVRGIDFYQEYLKRIKGYTNINFKQEKVVRIDEDEKQVTLTTSQKTYTADFIFNSMFSFDMAIHQKKYPVLQQHFIGWIVKTEKPIFDIDQATYMDFSVPQKDNTRFMYVLPFTKDTALVEYTLFSENLLPKKEYEEAIESYLKNQLGCSEYELLETEKGSIPMTSYDFKEHNTKRVRQIGTADGWAKPSTGYTFMSTSKKIPKLVAYIKTDKPLKEFNIKNRFWLYDLLFLDVLHKNNGKGHQIFQKLFKRRKPQLIFKFLDEQTNILEDVYYIAGCPKLPFIKALLKRIF